MRTLTNSALQTWIRCHHLYNLHYMHRLRLLGNKSWPLRMGSAVHDGVESVNQGQGMTMATQAVDASIGECDNGLQLQQARIMVRAYSELAKVDKQFIETEKEITWPLRDGYKLRGKADGLCWRDGKIYLYELKTTSKTVRHYRDVLTKTPQIHAYSYMLSKMGYEIAGTIIEVIKKPLNADKLLKKDVDIEGYKTRLLKQYRDDPERMFLSEVVKRDRKEEQRVLKHFHEMADDIDRREEDSNWDQLPTIWCEGPYGWCDKKAWCWQEQGYKTKYHIGHEHEELSADKALSDAYVEEAAE